MAKGHGEKLSRKQELAVAALLEEATLADVAARVGVNEKTIREWSRQPGFQAACRSARQDVLERTVARLLATTGQAIDTLRRNLGSRNAQAANRAAALILTHALRGAELLDLAVEIDALKRQMNEVVKHGDGNTGATGGTDARGVSSPENGNGDDGTSVGATASGSGAADGVSGNAAGPVAVEPATLPITPDAAALFPPVG